MSQSSGPVRPLVGAGMLSCALSVLCLGAPAAFSEEGPLIAGDRLIIKLAPEFTANTFLPEHELPRGLAPLIDWRAEKAVLDGFRAVREHGLPI